MIRAFPIVEGVSSIAIPVPHLLDLLTVNMYAVGKGPITLIDAGLKSRGALEFVLNELKQSGFDFGNIERIIITHGHMDHFGLAASIRKLAGHFIDCFIHPEDRWRLSSDGFEMEMLGQDASDFMAMAGMPVEEMERIKKRFSSYKALGDPLDEVSAMEDGDEFCQGDFRLKVIHTPGHTPGTCCLYECEQKILFSGDHILKSITPNPFVALNRAHLRDPDYQSLRAYCSSLNKLEELDALWVFPGHGEYLEDLRDTISTYRKHHHERMEVVWNALRKEPRPLYYLIGKVFPSVPRDDLFHAISEIFVHLEMLINERKAELVNPGPPALYRAL